MRYELTDYEWAAIRPFLPNRPRGVPRVDDRRVLNGSRSDLAIRCTMVRPAVELWPHTTCYNHEPFRPPASGKNSCSPPTL